MTTVTDCPGCSSPYSLHRRGCPAENGNGAEPTLDSQLGLLAQLGTSTSLNLPDGLAFDTWRNLGAVLVTTEQRIQWWLGDWWNYGEDRYGPEATQAIPFGYSAETLRKCAYVAREIPAVRRRTELPWGTHDAVASCKPDEQTAILDRAEREHLNRHHVREIAKRVRAGGPVANGHHPPEPQPAQATYRCPECGHEWSGAPRPT